MFNLCQTVHISHQHHHHFQEVVIPPGRGKEHGRARSPRIHTKMGQANSPVSGFGGQGLKVYHSIGSYHQRCRKGIEVVSKQNSKKQSNSVNSDTSVPNKLHFTYSSSKKQAKIPLFFNQPPIHPQSNDREHCQRYQAQQGNLFANYSNKSDKSKGNKIDPLLTIQISPPSLDIGKQSHQTSLTHFSRHYLRPFAYRFSSKTGESSNLTFSNQTRDWRPSTKTEEKPKEEEAQYGFKSNHERLERPQRELPNKISFTINRIKVQSNQSTYQEMPHTQKLNKLYHEKKQLFDTVSITSRESNEIDENMSVEESFLVSRQTDNFIEIAQRRQLEHCKLVLAMENGLHCLVSLKIYENYEDKSHQQESLIRLKGQLDNKQFSPFLQLYQVITEGSGFNKRIVFVQQPYEKMLDEQISSQQLKNDRSAQEQLQNSMLQCVAEAYDILDHKSIYLAKEMNLDDFVLANGRIKIHSLSKFKQSEQLLPRELIPQHRTIKHLKQQFLMRMGQ